MLALIAIHDSFSSSANESTSRVEGLSVSTSTWVLAQTKALG